MTLDTRFPHRCVGSSTTKSVNLLTSTGHCKSRRVQARPIGGYVTYQIYPDDIAALLKEVEVVKLKNSGV